MVQTVQVVNPKVEVLDYGPVLKLDDGTVLTPDELDHAAGLIAFKGENILREVIGLKQQGELDPKKVRGSLIKSVGSGHASLATTPGMWVEIREGSKLVDSIFTGAVFLSALMPSGRRVPIDPENIVVPRGIHNNSEAEKLYLRESEANVRAYEKLIKVKVPKQEATKIVQYGLSGGGFMFMPLETLRHFIDEVEFNRLIPQEGREIVDKLRRFAHEHGIGITLESRVQAPRTGCVNAGIFHDRVNEAQELIELNAEALYQPILIDTMHTPSPKREKRIQTWLKRREEIFKSPIQTQKQWGNLLKELDDIVVDYNNSARVKTLVNTPWRVLGEVKRHRTLDQTTEGVYHGAERAILVCEESERRGYDFSHEIRPEDVDKIKDLFLPVVSLPQSVLNDRENLRLWLSRFTSSVKTYKTITQMGVSKSDAITIIPRGLKLGIVKTYGVYNMTTGYASQRLCGSCEPEMRVLTEQEVELIKGSDIGEDLKNLIGPKCSYVGFCTEMHREKPCGKIRAYVPDYDVDAHKRNVDERTEKIEGAIRVG